MNGRAILYADRMTGSMQRAIDETDRRRAIQHEHNIEHGITPHGVMKSMRKSDLITRVADAREQKDAKDAKHAKAAGVQTATGTRTREELEAWVVELEAAMREAAVALDFEAAARLRDELFEVRTLLDGKGSGSPARGGGGRVGGRSGRGRGGRGGRR